MNILQIHNYYQYKGGEDGVVEAEKKMLEDNGHKVFSLCAHNNKVRKLFSARKQFYEELEHILSENQIDVAHIHNVYQIIGNDIYQKLADKNIPIVQTLHNFRFLCPAGLMMDNEHKICELCSQGSFTNCVTKKCYQRSYAKSFFMQMLVKKGRKSVQQYVTKFLALNPFYLKKYAEAGFDQSKLCIKPNFLFDQEAEQYASDTDENYALFIGRISPEKGIEIVIDAFKNLPFKVKIAGTGDDAYVASLKERSSGFSNIEFCGFASGDKKHNLLKSASFLIVPSIWYENFPMTILEGYAYQKPVIASNIAGLPHIVKDQSTGYLFEPENSKSLQSAVINMIKDYNYKILGLQAYEYFKNNFTDKQNYTQLMSIYQEAIAEKSKKL